MNITSGHDGNFFALAIFALGAILFVAAYQYKTWRKQRQLRRNWVGGHRLARDTYFTWERFSDTHGSISHRIKSVTA